MFTRFLLFFVVSLILSNTHAKVSIGPFEIRGFAKFEAQRGAPICHRCALHPDEDRQREWADTIPAGRSYGPRYGTFSLIQPYLGTKKFNLGNGYKISGLISQRWRDGGIDIPGVLYERNITLEHDYLGTLQVGGFPTRGWGLADFPYGTHIGLADAWGASGSGYGILTHAIRYAFPIYDVFNGDFRLEYTRDFGDDGFRVLKPEFHEVWINYIHSGIIVDLIYQLGINGVPSSWTHGPFRGITNEAQHEQIAVNNGLTQNRQFIVLLMTHFPISNATYLYAGVRHNNWSGARAVVVGKNDADDLLWNNMFNVNWGEVNAEGVANPGYPASSTDAMAGFRYRFSRWTLNSGLVYLGEASTKNPLERGQSNSAVYGAVGLGYQPISVQGLSLYSGLGISAFSKKGLAPLSAPGHNSFGGIDSRVNQFGYGVSLGLQYDL